MDRNPMKFFTKSGEPRRFTLQDHEFDELISVVRFVVSHMEELIDDVCEDGKERGIVFRSEWVLEGLMEKDRDFVFGKIVHYLRPLYGDVSEEEIMERLRFVVGMDE